MRTLVPFQATAIGMTALLYNETDERKPYAECRTGMETALVQAIHPTLFLASFPIPKTLQEAETGTVCIIECNEGATEGKQQRQHQNHLSYHHATSFLSCQEDLPASATIWNSLPPRPLMDSRRSCHHTTNSLHRLCPDDRSASAKSCTIIPSRRPI